MMNLKQNIKSIIGVVVVLALVGGYYYIFVRVNTLTGKEAEIKQQEVASIINAKEIQSCESLKRTMIDGTDYYSVCVNNIAESLAMKNLDASYCEKLDDKLFSRANCKSAVAVSLAIQKHDSGACSVLEESQKRYCVDTYLYNEATFTKNAALCGEISIIPTRQQCNDQILAQKLIENPTKINCSEFSQLAQSDCDAYKKALSATRDTGQCSFITNQILSSACISKIK